MSPLTNLPDRITTMRVNTEDNTAPMFAELEAKSEEHLQSVDILVQQYNALSTQYAAIRNAISVRMGAYHYSLKHAGHIPANVELHQLLNRIVVVKPSMYIFEKEKAYDGSVVQKEGTSTEGSISTPWTACIRDSFDESTGASISDARTFDRLTGTDSCDTGNPAMITFKDNLCAPKGDCPQHYRRIAGFTGTDNKVPTGLRQCYSMYRYLRQGDSASSSNFNWGYNQPNGAASQFVCPNMTELFKEEHLQQSPYKGDVLGNLDQKGKPKILGSDSEAMHYMSHNLGTKNVGDATFPNFDSFKSIESITLTPISVLKLRKSTNAEEGGSEGWRFDLANAGIKARKTPDGNEYVDLKYTGPRSTRTETGVVTDWVRAFIYLPNLMLVRSAIQEVATEIIFSSMSEFYEKLTTMEFDYIYFFFGKYYAVDFKNQIGKYLTPTDFLSADDQKRVALFMRIPGVRPKNGRANQCYPRIHPTPNHTAIFDVGDLHRQTELTGEGKLTFVEEGGAVDSYSGVEACSAPDKLKDLTDLAQTTLAKITEKSVAIRDELRKLDEEGISSQMNPKTKGDAMYRENAKTYYELNRLLADAYQKLLTEQNELHVLDTSVDDMRRLGVSDRYKMIFYLIIFLMFVSSVYFVYKQSA